ncbi:MAG: L-threonylcarbamoyladenylate synthase [Roseovarius sp.]|nr:L-threonylcarbamoyladenylate synthase [Roseovarius sp.]MCY4290197.1 L-threonylcarbamoyladenylate synthase [Roseovarius sp.]MCY4315593.1 L-threonylcarbamoyladenylate synthase [Roseovarius sp.]
MACPTEILAADSAGCKRASDILSAGGLVAFPTETVYGLGGDARNTAAVARIFEAKNRPSFNPLIVHVSDIGAAADLVEWTPLADTLARAFWPGPLTLVMPQIKGGGLSPLATSELSTLAIRIPAHKAARELLKAFSGPISAPSANPSGCISPTRASHVTKGLSGKIEAVIDGGPCRVGLESTIVSLVDHPVLLRPGGLMTESIEEVLGFPLEKKTTGGRITSPGQLASHYAPDSPVRLNAAEKRPGEVLLGFGDVACDLNLSPSGDLAEAASNLFCHLHELDAGNPKTIAISPIPDLGIGRPINDRLRRAARSRNHE